MEAVSPEVTTAADRVAEPAWSPDGTRIAAKLLTGSVNYEVFTMTPQGGARLNLTNFPLTDGQPDTDGQPAGGR